MSTIKKQTDPPFKIWQAIGGVVGGVYQGIQAGKAAKKAEAAEAEAKQNQREMQDFFMAQDISNPFEGMTNAYAGLENKMEDLTVDQRAAASLQMKEASGEQEVATRIAAGEQAAQQLDMKRRQTLVDQANKEYNAQQGLAAQAQAQKDQAIGGAIESGIGLVGSFFGG